MKVNTIIGIDFSITKPGICIRQNLNFKLKYTFMGFPRPDQISENRKNLYKSNGVIIVDRKDKKNYHTGSSQKMIFNLENSQYLANLIFENIYPFLDTWTKISFEGFSFASTGDAILQLSGYKYILMNKLNEIVPLSNMYTYAPITLKKTANCSKKGLGKKDMIDSFLNEGTEFGNKIKKDIGSFKKKGGKNYIELLDDLVDSYFCIKTLEEKEVF